MIIEAPDQGSRRDTVVALERFADLRAAHPRAIIGFTSETEQEIALLYDPDRLTVRHDPQGEVSAQRRAPEAPRFDTVLRFDLDVDARPEPIRFSKPPLELAVDGGRPQAAADRGACQVEEPARRADAPTR